MASIKKVGAHLDAAEREISAMAAHQADPAVLAVLTQLHAAIGELAGIVRSDRIGVK